MILLPWDHSISCLHDICLLHFLFHFVNDISNEYSSGTFGFKNVPWPYVIRCHCWGNPQEYFYWESLTFLLTLRRDLIQGSFEMLGVSNFNTEVKVSQIKLKVINWSVHNQYLLYNRREHLHFPPESWLLPFPHGFHAISLKAKLLGTLCRAILGKCTVHGILLLGINCMVLL